MKRTVPRDPLRVALQIVVGGLCTLNHHERSFAISDLNGRIQFLLGHVSVLTTERYLGCKQNLEEPVNDRFGCLFARISVDLR
jgi:hypothetical protein